MMIYNKSGVMGRQATCNIKLVDETEPVQYSLIMSQESLYGVLMVDRNATLDEIKLAFKKRCAASPSGQRWEQGGLPLGVPST